MLEKSTVQDHFAVGASHYPSSWGCASLGQSLQAAKLLQDTGSVGVYPNAGTLGGCNLLSLLQYDMVDAYVLEYVRDKQASNAGAHDYDAKRRG